MSGRFAASVRLVQGRLELVAPAIFRPTLPKHNSFKDRQSAMGKLDRSLLFDRLNAHQRHLIFRPSKRQSGVNAEKVIVDGTEIKPQRYRGLPSRSDLQTVILTSRSAKDLDVALALIRTFRDHERLQNNLRRSHIITLLRKAGELGEFNKVYWALTVDRNRYQRLLGPYFYLEALRHYVLRVPFLNHNSKNMFYRLHLRSPVIPGRDLCLVYALAAYGKKFGSEHAEKLPEVLERTISTLSKGKSGINKVDVALGLAAVELLGADGKRLESALSDLYGKAEDLSATTVFTVKEPALFENAGERTVEDAADLEESATIEELGSEVKNA